jgi:hypothetical protein
MAARKSTADATAQPDYYLPAATEPSREPGRLERLFRSLFSHR